MLVSDETLEKIRSILDLRLNALTVHTMGRDQLSTSEVKALKLAKLIGSIPTNESLIEDIYLLSKVPDSQVKDLTASQFVAMRQSLINRLSTHEVAALKLLKQKLSVSLMRHATTVRGVVADLVLAANSDYLNLMNMTRTALEDGLLRRQFVGRLAKELRDKTGDLYRDWRRVAITEVTNAMNTGAMDRIISDNEGKNVNDIYVYKSVVMDAALCDVCRRVYLEADGLTPKVYTMAELQANGTNIGKKKADWKATVGATHPHCRGKLLELPTGWGFVKGSSTLKFYAKDFIWYKMKSKL